MYKPPVNYEPLELIRIIGKGQNTAWLHDNSRTNLAADGQLAPKATTTDFKTEPSLNNGKYVANNTSQAVLTPSNNFKTLPTGLIPTQPKAMDQPNQK